ncbi:hypothetical protein [Glycomyces sp. YM15]|uniref:hypothetical protein n=1 Tax=Glycomyces sp. YM15 TaxID=2800446 RepID=UPI001962B7A5|nr:hypothetical protein [Glycomyces sp. YM15]
MKIEHPAAYVVTVSLGALALLYAGISPTLILIGMFLAACPLLASFIMGVARGVGRGPLCRTDPPREALHREPTR